MTDNKLVKTLTDAATITGLADGFGWIANKVIKEPMTSDPSSNLKNYVNSQSLSPLQSQRNNILKIKRFCPAKKWSVVLRL